MPTLADLDFYRRREAQERQLAERATHPEGRHAHLELARCYARKIDEASDGPPVPLRVRMPGQARGAGPG